MDQEAEFTSIPITEEVQEIIGRIIKVICVTENLEAINIVSDNETKNMENEETANENSLYAVGKSSI